MGQDVSYSSDFSASGDWDPGDAIATPRAGRWWITWPRRIVASVLSALEWTIGGAALLVGLAIVAAIPIVQFASLGYMLEASGRIARTGSFTAGFVGYRQAARVGGLVLGAWLALLPLTWVASLRRSAELIDPHSDTARKWGIAVLVLAVLTSVHLVAACFRGGRLRHFLLPSLNLRRLGRRLRRGGLYVSARDGVWNFIVGLRLPYLFWLGTRGFFGGLIWLLIPVMLIAGGRQATLVGWIGALLLMIVVCHLPFLQARLATENRWRAIFEWRAIRQLFRRAPLAYWIAIMATLLSAIPLYLLKIEMVPRQAQWLPSLVFVTFMLPARWISGWAYGRSLRHEQPRWLGSRWVARLGFVPVVAFYVLMVFFSQYTSWQGMGSLVEQHAFLLPVPFASR
ncbi:MAG: DUF4013 domain-containing protein [Pirellulales bacterium]